MKAFDPSQPNIARVWDYWLGGKDNFAPDRELATKMLAVQPVSALMAQEARQFLGRAVRYVTIRGVKQFIDVGAGLPTAVNTHDVAQETDPQARVAYVDNDPMVISHARALLANGPGVIAVPGDMADPEAILADADLRELIDLAKPACVILSAILHFADAATARNVVGAFARAMVPGSYLIISVAWASQAEWDRFIPEYKAAPVYGHSREEIGSFFAGFELVPPGVVPVRFWDGHAPVPELEERPTFLGGVAHKA